MLVFGEKLIGMPILSLQTSQQIAQTESAVINPANLEIVAYYVSGPTLDFSPALLRVADIREVGQMGGIVNSSDEFVQPEDLVKLRSIIELQFELEGLNVIDENKQKLGKVVRYALDPETFMIHQLHVKRPLFKSFSDSDLLINRSQIIAISQKVITVKSTATRINASQQEHSPLKNPFKQPQPKAEAIEPSKD